MLTYVRARVYACVVVDRVYNLFNTDGEGILIDQYISYVSICTTGTLQDKLALIFRIYDTNRDGDITRQELSSLVDSICRLTYLKVRLCMGQLALVVMQPHTDGGW